MPPSTFLVRASEITALEAVATLLFPLAQGRGACARSF